MTESLQKESEDISGSEPLEDRENYLIGIEHLVADTEMNCRAVLKSLIRLCMLYSSPLCLLASVVE